MMLHWNEKKECFKQNENEGMFLMVATEAIIMQWLLFYTCFPTAQGVYVIRISLI